MNTDLKALSVQQPWARFITEGIHVSKDILGNNIEGYFEKKNYENRTWKTKFRGWVLIHAPLRIDRSAIEFLERRFHTDVVEYHKLISQYEPVGGIVGAAYISDCLPLQEVSEQEIWASGPYCFKIEKAISLAFQPCKGALSFFRPEVSDWYLLTAAEMIRKFEQTEGGNHGI
ncbi:hypothetical protein [Leptospira stimsonii]|uniref:ASCH domain-containing protein n=1 Tax=Leptospira stimsonii TaxID=2202203 RepID=A0ABY2MXP5_9LEPT|nr:hypothetical protein [Leptospira stimsonii]TGK12834.1 hypothetical protein EHO98_19540 [Leptospira stimsonii]TGM11088.1 hypothetical protein EHQ90_16855 [Leptospira stimsonii]